MEIQGVHSLTRGASDLAARALEPDKAKQPGQSFGDVVKGFLEEVNDLQTNAGATQEKFLSGEVKDLQQVVVAMSKADIAFRYMLEIRNKLVDAYQEVMRTRV